LKQQQQQQQQQLLLYFRLHFVLQLSAADCAATCCIELPARAASLRQWQLRSSAGRIGIDPNDKQGQQRQQQQLLLHLLLLLVMLQSAQRWPVRAAEDGCVNGCQEAKKAGARVSISISSSSSSSSRCCCT
jgi:hypothetical protein